jgi:multiple sugar transport system permease protein
MGRGRTDATVPVGKGEGRPRSALPVGLWPVRPQEVTAFLFVLPAVLLVGGLVAYPFLYALSLSLTSKQAGVAAQFIGLRNFTDLMHGEIFRRTVRNSLLFTGVAVVFKTILGLGLALLLRRAARGRRVIRGMILLPWVVPSTLSVLGWWWMFDPLSGVVNLGLSKLGLIHERIPWLSDPFWAMVAVIIVNVWRGLPFFGISFLAGLVSIPEELYEAAQIDGAGKVACFARITVPMLRPVLGVIILYSIIMTVSDFNIVYVLTRGGPMNSTHLFATFAYEMGLASGDIGKGAAISLFIFPFLAAVAYLQLRITRRQTQ